jgi:hypothetical protein
VPESSTKSSIDLYECVNFPYDWKLIMTLMENVNAVDTTLFYHNDFWWLFTAMPCNPNSPYHKELYLFYSDTLFTNEWIPHPLNPIVTDVKNFRPAGKLIIKNGKIYRPSQYCTDTYGVGINLYEIDVLSENDYKEIKVNSIKPNWNKKLIGTHTFTYDETFTIIDVFTKRFKFR